MYPAFESDVMDDWFDVLADEDFDAASPRTREQRARAERQRRRRQQAQQRRARREAQARSQPPRSTASTQSALSRPSLIQSAISRGSELLQDARTKPLLQTAGSAIGLSSNPTAQAVSQWIGALVDSMPADEFEEEAIDAAAPAIAQMTVRAVMPQAVHLPSSARCQIVSSVTDATHLLAQQQGIQATRAIPRIVQSVQRTARHNRVPVDALPQAVRRVTAQVAANPSLVRRLSQ